MELNRRSLVLLNRLQKDYLKDQLPNPEQIRYDVATLIALAVRLNEELVKHNSRQTG